MCLVLIVANTEAALLVIKPQQASQSSVSERDGSWNVVMCNGTNSAKNSPIQHNQRNKKQMPDPHKKNVVSFIYLAEIVNLNLLWCFVQATDPIKKKDETLARVVH